MDDWKKFNETSMLENEEFYSNLNMEDITNADDMHAKRVSKEFEMEKKGEYLDLYLKSDTLPLADAFKNFRKICLKIYHLDLAKFLSAPGLPWQAALKRAEVKLQVVANIDILLMVEKRIRGGICHAIHQNAKANNKNMKDCNKDKESSYLKY